MTMKGKKKPFHLTPITQKRQSTVITTPASKTGPVQKIFMMSGFAPTELTELAAKPVERLKGSLQVWLVLL